MAEAIRNNKILKSCKLTVTPEVLGAKVGYCTQHNQGRGQTKALLQPNPPTLASFKDQGTSFLCPANAGDARDLALIPGLRRSLRVGNGIPLQYSCLENPRDRGTWPVAVHGLAKSRIHTCLLLNKTQ